MRDKTATPAATPRPTASLTAAGIAHLARSRIGQINLRALALLLEASRHVAPQTQLSLLQTLGLTHSQMARAAETLVRAGLLRRTYALDRRQKCLAIQRAGTRLLHSAAKAAGR